MRKYTTAAVLAALAFTVPAPAQVPALDAAPSPAAEVAPSPAPAQAEPTATTPAAPTDVQTVPMVDDGHAPVPLPMDAPSGPPADRARVWAQFDYLLGWVKGDPLPPLVTTSPAGTVRTSAGVLGQPGTTVLFGNNEVNQGARSGLDAEFGLWFGQEHNVGLEGGFFFLANATRTFFASSDGTTILARPFFDVSTGNAASSLIGFPGVSSGSVGVTDTAHDLYGGGIDLRENFCCCCGWRFDSLLGYRYLRYSENLTIQQNTMPIGGAFVAGTQVQSTDSFGTVNTFNGADFGMRADMCSGRWFVDLLARVAVGRTQHTVDIQGSQTVTVPGATPVTNTGGLLALPTNIGVHTQGDWAAVPELGLTVGWQVLPAVRLDLGYSVFWWGSVNRPGEQIDLNVTSTLIPPATATPVPGQSPNVTGVKDTLWVQELHFGVELRY
jgi:hypothetical protein